ncbi:hypothetical protein GE061_013834 [Apolygus lucorum]|uniref:Uncharacterized protein n=1 Tax=Apolygus lucorum TaxID=248454 RepID=A0A8S9XSY6_APOLU|nr:hypothetical protein GE061_013834 [Apolygus lucorum]
MSGANAIFYRDGLPQPRSHFRGNAGQLFGSASNVLSQWGAKRTYTAVMPKPPATLSGIDHLTDPNLNKVSTCNNINNVEDEILILFPSL